MNAVREAFVARLGDCGAPVEPGYDNDGETLRVGAVRIERWRIRGRRGAIPALFLMPPNVAPPWPVVLAFHPHGRQFELGKSLVAGLAGEPSRAYALRAAEAGFAVLAPDQPGFEDHRPGLAARKRSYALQGEAYERLLANEALVTGATLQGWMLADASACVDALALDERVDAARLAALGSSFGGQQVVFSMLYDTRLRAGVACCGFSLVQRLVDARISHNMALYVPGLLPELDFDVLVGALAPRPLYVIAGTEDAIFPVDGVQAVEKAAQPAYADAGAAAALRFHYFRGPHDVPADALHSALDWLREVLA